MALKARIKCLAILFSVLVTEPHTCNWSNLPPGLQPLDLHSSNTEKFDTVKFIIFFPLLLYVTHFFLFSVVLGFKLRALSTLGSAKTQLATLKAQISECSRVTFEKDFFHVWGWSSVSSSKPWPLLTARDHSPRGSLACVYIPPFPGVHNGAAEMTIVKTQWPWCLGFEAFMRGLVAGVQRQGMRNSALVPCESSWLWLFGFLIHKLGRTLPFSLPSGGAEMMN